MNIHLKIEVFKEDDIYVALAPELNISSFGETIEDAKKSLKEAIEAFIEECERMGSLGEVLEESDFQKVKLIRRSAYGYDC
ncbi:MAG: type II toxin-antitoxin system HicB family antitoxin [Nitrospirae bacterium]|nr:type II toxin-antitoxin system HicB family antitoxin [Nitrospirota bacterium]MCL5978029.1 type II toxin-antitoxin system HicB family antitoxin [Nitrospirota bacterium]